MEVSQTINDKIICKIIKHGRKTEFGLYLPYNPERPSIDVKLLTGNRKYPHLKEGMYLNLNRHAARTFTKEAANNDIYIFSVKDINFRYKEIPPHLLQDPKSK